MIWCPPVFGGHFMHQSTALQKVHRNSRLPHNYRAVVAQLSARWRVVECRDGVQWILQRFDGTRHGRARWTGRSYCRTREGLKRACRTSLGELSTYQLAMLDCLPEWMEGGNDKAA